MEEMNEVTFAISTSLIFNHFNPHVSLTLNLSSIMTPDFLSNLFSN